MARAGACGRAERTGFPLRPTAGRILRGLVLLGAATRALAQEGTESSVPENLVREVGAALREAGFPVDLARLKVETRPREACREDLERQQDLFFSPEHFEAAGLLYRAFGLIDDAADLRTQVVRSFLSSLHAYYQPDRQAIVLLESDLGRLLALRPILAHELAHAWRDQVSGIRSLLGRGPRTWEEVGVFRCLLEGEAEVVAIRAMLAKEGKDLGSVKPEAFESPLGRLLAGESAVLPYEAGAKWVLRSCKETGGEALNRLWTARPPSTEQILHPTKAGRDSPAVVGLPPWPKEGGEARLLREDVVGELALYALLLDCRLERSQAWIAAAGWDGDRLRVYRRGEKDLAFLWRIACDREEDARQLAKALEDAQPWRLWGGVEVRTRGACVDLAFAEPADVAERLVSCLEAFPLPPAADPSDGESTAAMEEAWLAAQLTTRVEDGMWILPRLRLRIPAPEGWTVQDMGGVPILFAPTSEPIAFRDNLNVQVLPLAGSEDVDDLLEENKSAIEGISTLSLDVAERRTIDGRDVAYVRYHGQLPNLPFPLRFLCVLCPQGESQVVITATVHEERWAAAEASLEKAFAGISFEATASGPTSRPRR